MIVKILITEGPISNASFIPRCHICGVHICWTEYLHVCLYGNKLIWLDLTKFCKRVLGVHSRATNIAVAGELGRFPPMINIVQYIIVAGSCRNNQHIRTFHGVYCFIQWFYLAPKNKKHISKYNTTHYKHNYIYQPIHPTIIHSFITLFIQHTIH